MRRVSGWSFRLVQEDKRAYSSSFLTLTYNTQHVPLSKKGFMTLSKTDLQSFFKRLRYYEKEHRYRTDSKNNSPIRYYAVGEYGSRFSRPHYHIILFNASIESIEKAWCIDGKPIGEIYHGYVSEASVGYCLKYINKPSKIPLHQNDDRKKEFALMSKRLGDNYINDRTKKWHTSNLHGNYYLPLQDGKKASIPRYYKEKLYAEEQRKAIGFLKRIEMDTDEPISELERMQLVQVHMQKLKRLHRERTCNNFH
jgi:hypothetical protein